MDVRTATDQIIKKLRVNPIGKYLLPADYDILDRIIYLSLLTAQTSKKNSIYCMPSEQWLGNKIGTHRVTVSRRTSALEQKGLIYKLQRRQVAGKWQTNIYKLGSLLYAIAAKIIKSFLRYANRVTSMLHQSSYNSSIYMRIKDKDQKTSEKRLIHLKKESEERLIHLKKDKDTPSINNELQAIINDLTIKMFGATRATDL